MGKCELDGEDRGLFGGTIQQQYGTIYTFEVVGDGDRQAGCMTNREKLVKGWLSFETRRRHSSKLLVDSLQTMSGNVTEAYLLSQEASNNGIVRLLFNCLIPQFIQKWGIVGHP